MKEISKLFLRLGGLGFGGPIATMAMMEKETVTKRQWLSPDRFAQSYAILKVLPGPTATQMAIYLGRLRGGTLGGFLAGILFIAPSFFLVLAISYFYERFRVVPQVGSLFQGMQVGALVVIGESVVRMARPYSKSAVPVLIALVSAVLIYFKPGAEPLVILGFGFIGAFGAGLFAFSPFCPFFADLIRADSLKLDFVCLKAALLTFGTGLAVVPLLEADVVGKYHWLTHSQFLDGLAIGQLTPGPVVITSTFIGYSLSGFGGALGATTAMFLPGFINILFVLPLIEKRIQDSPRLKRFSQYAIPAVIGGIVGTTGRLGVLTIDSVALMGLLVVTVAVAFWGKLPAWLLIVAAGFSNFLLFQQFHH